MAQHVMDYFEALVDAVPDRDAVTFRSQHDETLSLTFRELDERINRAAAVLTELGIKRGDHIGCHLYDTPAHVDTMLAAWKLGAVPINVNFRYVTHELLYLFEDADLKVVVTEPELADSARAAAQSAPQLQHVIVADDTYEARLAAASPARPQVKRSPDDLYILYTGGTTGMPKGVMWRMEDALHSCFGIDPIEALQVPGIDDPQMAAALAKNPPAVLEALRIQCPLLPLMHAAGQWALGRLLTRGSKMVIMRDVSFDPKFALQVIQEEDVAVVWAAGDAHGRPILDTVMTEHHGTLNLPKLVLWVSGAVMITPAIKAGLEQSLPGTFVMDGLGASETGAQGQAVGYSEEGSPRFQMGDGATILDDRMRPLPPTDRTIGKLAKTGHIPLGYYNDATKTAETFPVIDGVRYSVPGDLARWEDDGSITLFGRGSVSINSGGEKIFPEEVEKALKTHPSVFDAVVVGTPNERFGKQVTAVVQLRPGHSDPGLQELAAHCKKSLAGYKAPRAIVLQDSIVRSPSGKPDYPWAAEVAKQALQTAN